VADRAAEGVPCTESVDDVDGDGRHDDPLVAASTHHARRALLDDRQADAGVEQCVGGTLGVALADSHLALLEVADRHVDEGQGG
jgi:hypothetical protein